MAANANNDSAKTEYSADEIDQFINMGKQLAGKPVLFALAHVLRERNAMLQRERVSGVDVNGAGVTGAENTEVNIIDINLGETLAKQVESLIPYKYCAFFAMEFPKLKRKINICLSLVEKDYKLEVWVPESDAAQSDANAQQIFTYFQLLKKLAPVYYKQFWEEQPELMNSITEYCRNIDLSELRIDPENINTLYFDPNSPKRVGIFCYMTDMNGKLLATKNKSKVGKSGKNGKGK
jgi:hypothetical protein